MKLLFRVDASPEIGTGHLMRCLALAQAQQDASGEAAFVVATQSPLLEGRLRAEGMQVYRLTTAPGGAEDAEQTVRLAKRLDVDWVVVDGTHFDDRYQQRVKAAGLHLLYVDDQAQLCHYHADIVLNQNLHAKEDLYSKRESYTRLMLGSRYVGLRREFKHWQSWQRTTAPVARRILVTMGGSDPSNATQHVMGALDLIDAEALEVTVVVGGSNPRMDALCATARSSMLSIEVKRNVADMPSLMAHAEMAISSGGTTVWELAYMGLPAVIGATSLMEERSLSELRRRNLFSCVDSFSRMRPQHIRDWIVELMLDMQARRLVSYRGREIVDGLGANRVLQAMTEWGRWGDGSP